MDKQTKVWLAALMVTVVVGVSGSTRGDIIELKDGSKVSGTMVRQGEVMVITRDSVGGGLIRVTPEEVVRVTLTPSLMEADWVRTTMDLKKADKFEEYLAIMEGFAARHSGTPMGVQVQKMATAYEAMAAEEPVKFPPISARAGGWMPKALAEVLERAMAAKVKAAMEPYQAGKLREALDAAKEALTIDDTNTTALALTGLVNYRLNDLPESRKAFLKLVDASPGSVLGWNNLAVVAFALKREPEGLEFYTKALQTSPANRLLLENVIEAMHAYSGDKTAAAYKDLERQFGQADADKGRDGKGEGQGFAGVQRIMDFGDETPPAVASPARVEGGAGAPKAEAPAGGKAAARQVHGGPVIGNNALGAVGDDEPVFPIYPGRFRPVVVVPPGGQKPIVMPPWGGPVVIPPGGAPIVVPPWGGPVVVPPAPTPTPAPAPAPKGEPRYFDEKDGGKAK